MVVEKAVADGLGMEIDVKNSQGGQLGRGPLQNHLYVVHDGIEVLLQTFLHQSGGNLSLHRQPCDDISALPPARGFGSMCPRIR